MEVILKQDVDNLGQSGEVVRVAPGYARNFLFPKELAVQATRGNLKNLRQFMEAAEKKRNAERDEAQKIADQIAALDVVIEAKAGEKNRLFGSVTGQDVADFVNAALNLSIDKKKVNTAGPIKMLGRHKIMITVYPGLVIEKEILVSASAESVTEAEAAPSPKEEPVEETVAAQEEVIEGGGTGEPPVEEAGEEEQA